MFSGEDEHTMDTKGRVFIPAKHRAELGETVFMSRGMDGQINLYPEATWREMTERVAQADLARTAIRNTSRFLFSATSSQLDRQGRIVLPAMLRRYAELDTDVIIIGHNDHLEIWNPDRWQETCNRLLAQMRENRDDTEKVYELNLSL